jgi:hypothetical protein
MGIIAETSVNSISQQNGHPNGGCIRGADTSLPPPQPYQDNSPIVTNYLILIIL